MTDRLDDIDHKLGQLLDEVGELRHEVGELRHADNMVAERLAVLRRDHDHHIVSDTAHGGVAKTADNAWRAVVGITSVIVTGVILAILALVLSGGTG